MVALFFFGVLEISFMSHLYFASSFISQKRQEDFRKFIITGVVNVFLSLFLAMIILINPREIDAINLERILFVESGALLLVMLYLKGVVSIRIYRRMQDPSHFHYSYFGKKVVHPSVVTSKDLFIYFLTIPVTVICGAYFASYLFCG